MRTKYTILVSEISYIDTLSEKAKKKNKSTKTQALLLSAWKKHDFNINAYEIHLPEISEDIVTLACRGLLFDNGWSNQNTVSTIIKHKTFEEEINSSLKDIDIWDINLNT